MRAGLWPTDADPWGRNWDVQSVMVERRGDMEVIVPSLHHADTLATASDDYLRRIISHGRPGTKMPAWAQEGGLTDDEIDLLVRFIRGWDQPAPDLAAVSADQGDSRVGSALFRANCASCHGISGEGAIGNSLNSPEFLAVASDAFLRDTIVHGRPNTAMPAWREFTTQELCDLLAHLRSWRPLRAESADALAMIQRPDARGVSAIIGRTLFTANCVMCHGDNGGGDLGPSLNTQSFLAVASDSYLVETLVQGRPQTGMPSWLHMSNEDVASLVRFMRTWQTAPAKSEEWHQQVVVLGDWDAGRSLFAGFCASCHGRDGEGATGPQLNNPGFLELASDVMLREWISNGKDGTEMRAFRKGGQGVAELSERQVEDNIAYLRLVQRMGEGELLRVAKSPHGRPERGATIYAENCVGCHGASGEGASGPALANPAFLRHASDGFLLATMALGRTGTEMRPVKRTPQSILNLSSDEVNDLVAYLRTWEHAPPAAIAGTQGIPHRFVIPWDLARGSELFATNCAGCHGVEGKGAWAPELNNEGFLAAASDGFLQATIIRGRAGTAMRAFGQGANGLVDLAPGDVDDIVAYIRSWSRETPSPMTLPAQRSLQAAPASTGSVVKETPEDHRTAQTTQPAAPVEPGDGPRGGQ
jgi:mono/diheme cytochrome c family protein